MRIELPPEPVHFVNRDDERERALRAVDDWQGRSRPLIMSLSGPAGLGKSELAYLIARTVRDRYPDGVLSVDLDDFRLDGVLDPADVLAQLLRSLDVEDGLLARQFKARCRQYWSLTADLGLVLVVDNVRYASELVPLLPASGASLVIVASHGPLYDLEDGAAIGLPLHPLTERAATELLELIVRDDRLAEDPAAVRALVGLCEGLPTALHVAGRWIRAHRLRPLPRLMDELRGEWSEKGVPGVERIWDTAYHALSEPAARLYRLLPHHPTAAFTPDSATALLGLGSDACQGALEELDRAGVLDLRATPGDGAAARMRLPGPLRAHALRRSRRDAAADEAREAQARVVRWYVRQAQRADLTAAGTRLVVTDRAAPLPDAPDTPLPEAPARAAQWLLAERHTLFACVRLAHTLGLDAEAVALSEPLWTYALDHPGQAEAVDAFRLARDAAVRHGGSAAWLVRTRVQLARQLWELGDFTEARNELDAAQSAADLLGATDTDRKLTASVLESHGMLKGAQGHWADAVTDFAASRDVHRVISNPYGVMLQTYRMGEALARLDDTEGAHRLLAEAHASAREQGRARMTLRTGFALAGVLARLDRRDEARVLYEESLDGARGRGSGFDEARVRDAMADLAVADGRHGEAEEHRRAAHEIRHRNGLA
ncbi:MULTISPECIES: hypothetical protein [unclassified Streptomyces]|uniref:hypothetical protein n=1 Tax=unclassified Streptomyces TaxID=2593676 RepID=UPI00278C0C26|nr:MULTISPECIES: hypothetical protein [unclassified Streptomyces]